MSETGERRRRRGRREDEIDPRLPEYRIQFAQALRDLRAECGSPSYKELAAIAGYGGGTLSESANGRRLPTVAVMTAYVTACLKYAEREQEAEHVVAQWEDRLREVSAQETNPAAVDEAAHTPKVGDQEHAPLEKIVPVPESEQPVQTLTIAVGLDGRSIEPGNSRNNPQLSDDETNVDPKGKRKRIWIAVLLTVAVVAVVASGAKTHWWGLSSEQPGPPKTWLATIDNTWSDHWKAYLGVFKYRNPDEAGATDKSFYAEDTVVNVVCQSRHRRLIEDETMKTSSDVWNKLDDGYWIPDLYTNLPKDKPLKIPDCPD